MSKIESDAARKLTVRSKSKVQSPRSNVQSSRPVVRPIRDFSSLTALYPVLT
jgi:hypothetical protein